MQVLEDVLRARGASPPIHQHAVVSRHLKGRSIGQEKTNVTFYKSVVTPKIIDILAPYTNIGRHFVMLSC